MSYYSLRLLREEVLTEVVKRHKYIKGSKYTRIGKRNNKQKYKQKVVIAELLKVVLNANFAISFYKQNLKL